MASSRQTRQQAQLGAIQVAIARFQDATHLFDAAAAESLGLNPTDLRATGVLWRSGPVTATALARAVGISPGAMTSAIDRMERAGYVRRVRDESDRRRVLVEVTQRFKDLAEPIWGPIATEGTQRLKAYSDAELELVQSFLEDGYELQARHATRVRPIKGT